MISENQRLLRSGKPKTDESLMGYIIRLTEQNGYPSPSWIINRARLTPSLNRFCSFVFRSPEAFRLLSDLTGTSISELSSTAYPRATEYSFGYHLFFGVPIHPYSMRLGYPKVCPACLSESLYCRRMWDISVVTTCLKHKCLLIDECPNCKRQITWIRNRVSVCLCEYDWRDATVTLIKGSELSLTQHVHQLCGLSVNESILQERFHQSPIINLELRDLLLVLFFFAGLYQGLSISTGKNLLPMGRNRDFHALLTKVYSVFEDWPNNFYEFLCRRSEKERKVPIIRYRLKSTLYRDFGKFYTGLYKVLSGSQFDFIRDAFIDYLAEEWDGGEISLAIQKKSKEQQITGKYVSKANARRLLEIDDVWINQLIEIGKLKTIVRSKGMKRLIFVDVTDIVKLMREVPRL